MKCRLLTTIMFLAGCVCAPFSSVADTSSPSQCGNVMNGKFVFTYECINDLMMLESNSTQTGWHYATDSALDGDAGGTLGSYYEMYGMAFRETTNEVWMVLNGNMSLDGYNEAVENGTINHGDILFDLSGGTSLEELSNQGKLFGIRYAAKNDSSAAQLGLYKNVTAKSVTGSNAGYATLQDYINRIASLNGILGFGDLPQNQSFYGATISLNAIASGDYAGPITFLSDADLIAAGYDTSKFPGAHTVAFKFQKTLIIDVCGVIGGDGTSCLDCKGVACGTTQVDLCGVCGGDNSTCLDCKGNPNGGLVVDQCGVCGGDGTSCLDCKGIPNGGAILDECGVCGGDNSTCKDCKGIPNGGAVYDACMVCGGDGSTCKDCKGVPNGTTVIDQCGVCGGDGTSCKDCAGTINGDKVVDACGVCGGDGSTCKDCTGTPNGGAVIDQCGVCNGMNNTCLDCKGVPNGTTTVDACGICGGTVSNPLFCQSIEQCPSQQIDQCGVCDGKNACLDCAGVPNGGSIVDCCGVCGGDGSTCLEKCKIYNLKQTKSKARRSMNALYKLVRKYSRQEMVCNKNRRTAARKRIILAKSIIETNFNAFSTSIADTIKICDTIFCSKKSLISIIKSIKVNTKTLHKLSRAAQYGAGKACPVRPREGKPVSAANTQYGSVLGAIRDIPSQACVN